MIQSDTLQIYACHEDETFEQSLAHSLHRKRQRIWSRLITDVLPVGRATRYCARYWLKIFLDGDLASASETLLQSYVFKSLPPYVMCSKWHRLCCLLCTHIRKAYDPQYVEKIWVFVR